MLRRKNLKEIGDEDPFEELAEERGAVRGEEEEIREEGEHLAPGKKEWSPELSCWWSR